MNSFLHQLGQLMWRRRVKLGVTLQQVVAYCRPREVVVDCEEKADKVVDRPRNLGLGEAHAVDTQSVEVAYGLQRFAVLYGRVQVRIAVLEEVDAAAGRGVVVGHPPAATSVGHVSRTRRLNGWPIDRN